MSCFSALRVKSQGVCKPLNSNRAIGPIKLTVFWLQASVKLPSIVVFMNWIVNRVSMYAHSRTDTTFTKSIKSRVWILHAVCWQLYNCLSLYALFHGKRARNSENLWTWHLYSWKKHSIAEIDLKAYFYYYQCSSCKLWLDIMRHLLSLVSNSPRVYVRFSCDIQCCNV